ncbi:MAG: Mrp/NBP35 family ATP-binding protein [Candidatus Eiseniibacteriota bacterium]
MATVSERDVLEALRAVQDPDLKRDLVSLGMIEGVRIEDGLVGFTIALTTPACPVKDDLKRQAEEVVRKVPGVSAVEVTMTSRVRGRANPFADKREIAGVAHVVAVGSGKGGVGKSTVAVNLAVALAQDGARVGLMDADVYGPNVPLMTGVREQPYQKDGKILPLTAHGLKLMSMGFLVDPETPVIWRGPMLHGVIQNFTREVAWGELDYLLIDLPPGTGDVQLSLVQTVPLSGAVIVATPQQVALDDAKKAIAMFRKTEVPILGMVENMSYFICPSCDARHEIFSHGGARAEAEALGIPFLGEIPLHPGVREAGDGGAPVLVTQPQSAQAEAFRSVARQLAARLSIQAAGAAEPEEVR